MSSSIRANLVQPGIVDEVGSIRVRICTHCNYIEMMRVSGEMVATHQNSSRGRSALHAVRAVPTRRTVRPGRQCNDHTDRSLGLFARMPP